VTSLVRIANTGGLKPMVELTSEPTGKKRMRTHYTPSPRVMNAAAETAPFPRHTPGMEPSRVSKRERKHTKVRHIDPHSYS